MGGCPAPFWRPLAEAGQRHGTPPQQSRKRQLPNAGTSNAVAAGCLCKAGGRTYCRGWRLRVGGGSGIAFLGIHLYWVPRAYISTIGSGSGLLLLSRTTVASTKTLPKEIQYDRRSHGVSGTEVLRPGHKRRDNWVHARRLYFALLQSPLHSRQWCMSR